MLRLSQNKNGIWMWFEQFTNRTKWKLSTAGFWGGDFLFKRVSNWGTVKQDISSKDQNKSAQYLLYNFYLSFKNSIMVHACNSLSEEHVNNFCLRFCIMLVFVFLSSNLVKMMVNKNNRIFSVFF